MNSSTEALDDLTLILLTTKLEDVQPKLKKTKSTSSSTKYEPFNFECKELNLQTLLERRDCVKRKLNHIYELNQVHDVNLRQLYIEYPIYGFYQFRGNCFRIIYLGIVENKKIFHGLLLGKEVRFVTIVGHDDIKHLDDWTPEQKNKIEESIYSGLFFDPGSVLLYISGHRDVYSIIESIKDRTPRSLQVMD